jgi:hypothetical protein
MRGLIVAVIAAIAAMAPAVALAVRGNWTATIRVQSYSRPNNAPITIDLVPRSQANRFQVGSWACSYTWSVPECDNEDDIWHDSGSVLIECNLGLAGVRYMLSCPCSLRRSGWPFADEMLTLSEGREAWHVGIGCQWNRP